MDESDQMLALIFSKKSFVLVWKVISTFQLPGSLQYGMIILYTFFLITVLHLCKFPYQCLKKFITRFPFLVVINTTIIIIAYCLCSLYKRHKIYTAILYFQDRNVQLNVKDLRKKLYIHTIFSSQSLNTV